MSFNSFLWVELEEKNQIIVVNNSEIDSNKLIRTLINKTWAYKVYSKYLITLKRRLNWVSLQRVMNFQHARKTLVVGSIIEALLHTRALLYTVNIKFSKSNTIFKTFWTTRRFGSSGMIEIQEEKFVVALNSYF